MQRLVIIGSIMLAASVVQADVDVGFRVGGYGFRREGDTAPGSSWTECRMNGFGIFGDKTLAGPLFIEAGLDLYSSQNFPTPAPDQDLPIDRASGLLSVAIGARSNLTSWLRGYVQLGAGMEVTSVSVPYGADMERIRDRKVMPDGFFGVGVDVKLARGTYLGASFRTLVMGNFDYAKDNLEMRAGWSGPPPAAEVFDASPDLAAQGQFYVRREL